MKRNLLYSAIVATLCIFVVCGCGNKSKLTCTKSQKDGDMKMNATAVVSFDAKGIAKKADMEITIDAGSKSNAETLKKTLSSSNDSIKVSGNKVILKSSTKPTADDTKVKYKEMKKELEKQEFKCK